VLNGFAFRVNELREFGKATRAHSDSVLFVSRDLNQAFDWITSELSVRCEAQLLSFSRLYGGLSWEA
jgi:hypothetical protein